MAITQVVSPPLDAAGTAVPETAPAETVPAVPLPAETVAAETAPPGGETSMLGRWVALFTPVFVVVAAWAAGRVAQLVPGAHLDQTELVSLMVAGATAALAAAWKWVEGWQQHELLVAQNKEKPLGKPRAK
jgi:hypothetical protein